jgi:hypothetical protein
VRGCDGRCGQRQSGRGAQTQRAPVGESHADPSRVDGAV